MKKLFILLAALMIMVPQVVQADLVSFRVGYYIPRAESDLWATEFENMDFIKSDFQASVFSFAYEHFFTNEFSLVIGVEGYTKQKLGSYRDFISEEISGEVWAFDYGQGFPISHVLSVSSTPVQASLKIMPLGRRGKFLPYLGGGVGIYLWSVRLQGEMIDFSDAEIFYDPGIDEDVIGCYVYQTDAREENKIALGYHGFAGVMVPIGNRISIDAQFKYMLVKGNLSDAFQGFEPFDLTGYQIVIGINYWF
ncbi:MAG: outer membrane beta-barrel protein [Acidobacteria bacterium]|nr:outer membrane beta-barrel protein [Acidobacteriota bacterium]